MSNPEDAITQMNQLIQQSTQALMCGPDCQKQKKISELKQNYLNAQTNAESASSTLSTAQQEYYTYTQGPAGYNKIIDSELEVKANKIADVMFAKYNESISTTTRLTDTSSNLTNNYHHILELYNEYVHKNKILKDKIRTTKSDIATDDRQTYYETQNLTSITQWYSIFKWIYIICLVAFILISLIKRKPLVKSVIIFIMLCLYPFIIGPIVLFIISIVKKIGGFIPATNNVYLSMK
jgi:hypothetical protein